MPQNYKNYQSTNIIQLFSLFLHSNFTQNEDTANITRNNHDLAIVHDRETSG